MQLTGIRNTVFLDRYALKDEAGAAVEKTPEEMWRRVAHAISLGEPKKKQKEWEEKFYSAMEDFVFVPGGRILSGAGTGYKVTFYNCFVIPSPHDSRQGILKSLTQMIEIMSRGGGVGMNLSSLRPRGSRVVKVNGFSSGPCNWAELFSVATKDIVQQGGCFAPGTRIMTHKGLIPVEEIVADSSPYFAATHKGYKKVSSKFDNGTHTVYEVKTHSGYTISVTGEHKMLTFDSNGEFFLKPLKDFQVGNQVVLLLGEWREDLPYVVLKTSLPTPSKHSYGLKNIHLPETLTDDLAFIVGVYHADGAKIPDEYSALGKGIRIAAAMDRTKDLETLKAAIVRCFGIEPKVRKGDGAVWNVQIFSRRLNEFLYKNGLLKDYSATVTVPEHIFRSPRRVVEAYIAGVFLGDGTNRGGKGGLRIATVSQQFAQELQLLLLSLGIASSVKAQDRTKQGWKTLYTVVVNGATFMKRFAKILSLYNEKINDASVSVRDGTFGWPVNLVERFIALPHFQRMMARSNPTTSRRSVAFLQDHISQTDVRDQPDIELLAGCVPDTIVSIAAMGQSPVYDLEVDDVHLLSGNGFYTSNSRRGALMIMLWDWHPDIEEFITVKQDLARINGANLSVCVSDAFMEAVKKDADWDLVFPDKNDPDYDEKWDGYMPNWIKLGKKPIVHKTIKARYLWDLVAQAAWKSAEPGVVFMERYNKWFNNYYWEHVNCVNPCVTGDTLVATEHGWKKAKELTVGTKILTPKGLKSIDKVYNNGKQQIFETSFSDGGSLRATADHKLRVARGDKFDWVKISDLQEKDRVLALKKDVPISNIQSITEDLNTSTLVEVIGIKDTGNKEDVYDVHEPETLTWVTNGYVSFDCGEEGLPSWGVCNLCSINLSALVNESGEMDYERLYEVSKIGVRFQDDVIDVDSYIFDEIKKRQMEGERRIGLGTMGLGDALIKMRLKYGSPESLPTIDRIYRTIRDAAYEASVELAKEKGAFPAIDIKKHLDAYFIKQLPQDTRRKMKKYGVRNSVILQQAPTGSTSLLSGVSSGIEPVYEFEFIRRDRLGEHILRHPLYDAWFEDFKVTAGREPLKEERPNYFVSANDLTPEDHVHVQATIQRHVDASISKTVNAPKTHTVEDVKRLYTLAYDLGCKGIAYMREGSRQGVLTRMEDTKKDIAPVIPAVPEVKPRPMVVHGSTYQVETPVGQAYVTINTNGGRQPLELFMNVGKAGSDVTAMAEAMGRLISLVFRLPSPMSPMERAHKVAAELIGIGGARSLGFGENRVRSLPDAIAKVIDRHFGFFTKHSLTDQTSAGVALSSGQATSGAVNGHASVDPAAVGSTPFVTNNSDANAAGTAVSQPAAIQLPLAQDLEQPVDVKALAAAMSQPRMVTVDLCPSCGEGSLVFEESCKKCYSCGYSEC